MKIHIAYTNEHPSHSEKRGIELAIEAAESSVENNRHGAVVIKNGKVVGRGWNKSRNHPSVLSPEHILTGASVHAEVMAMKMAGSQCKGAEIFVARIGANGPILSRPCNRCYNSILVAGIVEIIHT